MRSVTREELNDTLDLHKKWLHREQGAQRANLNGVDLCGADLVGANLYGANLYDASNILAVGPIGSSGGVTYAVNHGETIAIKSGCYWDSLEAWEARCREEHGDTAHGKAYAAAVAFIRAYAKAYGWNEQPDDNQESENREAAA